MKEKQNDTLIINRVRGVFALLAALIVVLGQTILYTAPTRQDTGIPIYMWLSMAGVVLFVLSLTLPVPILLQKAFAKLWLQGQLGWIAAATVFSILTVITMAWFGHVSNLSYLPVIFIWLGSAVCYAAAFTRLDLHGLAWREWTRKHLWELAAVGIVTLLAATLRIYRLGTIPRVINGDEGLLGLAAQSTTNNPLNNPFAFSNNLSAFYLQAINYVFLLFGANAFSVRLLSAIAGTLSIPATYLFSRQVAGKRIALIAIVLLAFSHFDLNYSRTSGGDYIFSTFFIPLILYALLSAIEKKSLERSALAGILLAIYFCTYQMAQVLVAVLLAVSLAMLFFRTWRNLVGRILLVFWGGFVIPVIPEAVYIWQHPDDFLARINASGTFQTGWLAQTAASTGQSIWIILAQRVVHAFLSLIYYPAIDYYGVPVPPLTLISAALFLIGLGLCLLYTRNLNYLILNAYFWGFTFAVGIFAIPPSGDTYRMLTAFPAAVLMAAIGLEAILDVIRLAWERRRAGYVVFTSLVLVSFIATNLWTYFGEFAGRCLYADNTVGRFASYMGSYAATLDPQTSIYLLSNDIYRYGTHASTDFLSGSHPITNVPAAINTVTIKPDESIIADPDRFSELEDWALTTHSGGQLRYFYDCSKVIMVVYQIP